MSFSIVHSHWNKDTPPKIQRPSEQCLHTDPSLIFFLFQVIPQAVMTDWQVVEGHQSCVSWFPEAQVMARPHPQVILLLQATAETSPLGCHVAVSMEMKRQAGHGSESHLHGQRLSVSEETSLPNSSCTQVVTALTPNPKPFILSFLLSLLKQA